MKITYTLTWEEYAEQFRDRWPRPDYFSAIVVCIVALPLIGYGISLAVFGMPDETAIDGMFIGGPLFLILATVLSLATQSKQAKKRFIAEKRRLYEQDYSREQSFSFDQDHWTSETETGKQDVPWSALQVAVDRQNIFYLTAQKGSVCVPGRALGPEATVALRELSRLTGDNKFEFRVSCWDFQAVGMNLLWRKRWFVMAFGNIFGLVVLGWIAQTWLSQNAKSDLIWGWILAAFSVILVLTAQLWYLPLRYATSPKSFGTSMRLQFYDSGIHFTTDSAQFFLAWKVLRKFCEIKRAFLVYTNATEYYLLAKRDITDDQQHELRKILEKNLKTE
jgi:hypothetical protein